MRYSLFDVSIVLTEPLLGTVPKNREIYAQYIAVKAASQGVAEEEVETIEDVEEAGWTGFHSDNRGLFLYDYQILGYLKEAGNILKDQFSIRNLRSKIGWYVYVRPRRIYLSKAAPDGCLERPLRGMTMRGERIALVRSDYVDAGTRINFQLMLLDNSEVTQDVLLQILEFGATRGLGQWRTGGYGRFKVERFRLVARRGAEDSNTQANGDAPEASLQAQAKRRRKAL